MVQLAASRIRFATAPSGLPGGSLYVISMSQEEERCGGCEVQIEGRFASPKPKYARLDNGALCNMYLHCLPGGAAQSSLGYIRLLSIDGLEM